jgi:rhodanese-related sulfurtransferase
LRRSFTRWDSPEGRIGLATATTLGTTVVALVYESHGRFIGRRAVILHIMSNTVIEPSTVRARADDNLYVLDIRPSYSYEEEHIEGSHGLPIYDQLKGENFIGLDVSVSDLPDDEEIAVVCFSGATAAVAAERLREHGFDAKAMRGGITDWDARTVGTVALA